MENVHIVMKITLNPHGVYHVTLIKQQDGQVEIRIDDCMKLFQLRTWTYEDVIEWVPFDKLSVIEEVGKGGFGSVYKVTWFWMVYNEKCFQRVIFSGLDSDVYFCDNILADIQAMQKYLVIYM
ncbi:hypothetical protein C2G38_2035948 [Gigaspora rosea]|uniref:Protein kinase domain-containing protein n=1 Tax=Gigaspora rosea TaxID=44941 RepID=A0A397VCW6_9GLOM|nr:hypothetical protein C2G38_2035948 [Gigaspora rosea]